MPHRETNSFLIPNILGNDTKYSPNVLLKLTFLLQNNTHNKNQQLSSISPNQNVSFKEINSTQIYF